MSVNLLCDKVSNQSISGKLNYLYMFREYVWKIGQGGNEVEDIV